MDTLVDCFVYSGEFAMLWTLDALTTYALTLTLMTLLVLVLLLRKKVEPGGVPLWLAASLIGVLLGAAATASLAPALGYRLVYVDENDVPALPASASPGAMGGGGGGASGGGGAGGGAGGGGMGGGGGGGMGMGGGQPSPKRQLTSLVRKLELLTGDIALNLSPEQAAGVAMVLNDLKTRQSLTDEEAQRTHDDLLTLLNASQRAKQEAIGLPPRRGGGGGGGGGGGPAGGQPAPDANPFAEGENAEALSALHHRLAGGDLPAQTGDDEAAAPAEPSPPTTDSPPTDAPESEAGAKPE
jgi:uncharacterized membrane protein YgcG